MRTLRSRFKRDTLGWRLAWNTYELWRWFFGPIERVWWRQVLRRVDLVKRRLSRYAVISGGTDCDGMRYAGVVFCHTQASVLKITFGDSPSARRAVCQGLQQAPGTT